MCMREGSWLIQIRMGGSRVGGKSRRVGRVGFTGIRIRNGENGKETRGGGGGGGGGVKNKGK